MVYQQSLIVVVGVGVGVVAIVVVVEDMMSVDYYYDYY
jgi:hypothetical protein